MTDLLTTALAWHQAGGCVLPAAADGTKRPALKTWQAYQQVRPPADQINAWLATNLYDGIGIVCGQTSGNLEMLELEGRAVTEGAIERLTQVVTAAGLGDLWATVTTDGYVEKTPSGGLHILYRVADEPVPGNLKLARRPATPDELAEKPGEKLKVLAETRGEGGWVVIAPSNGRTHPTGEPWEVIAGGPATVPMITAAQRHLLHQAFRTLDQVPAAEPVIERPRLAVVRADGDVPPGDDFETRTDWNDALLLGGAGWRVLTSHADGYRTWKRPGKDTPGISATTGHANDRDRLYVFSSATEFEQEHPYTKFGAYTLLHHAGDHSAAARELRRLGYGTPSSDASEAQQAAIHDLIPRTNGSSALAIQPELGVNPVEAYGATEDGLARALVAHHGDVLRYCPQRGKWLRWDEHLWRWDDEETHRELTRALARKLPDSENWRTFRKRGLSASGVAGVVRLAQSDTKIAVSFERLDSDPWALNTPHGVIDLRTGKIGDPNPASLCTRSTTCAPDDAADQALWRQFLADTFGDNAQLISYLQRLVGYSAVGLVGPHVLPFCFGSGGNGKGVFLEAIAGVLGDYATSAPVGFLMAQLHNGHETEIARLAGARMVICSEVNEDDSFDEAKVKQLTGGDTLTARFMRQDHFSFTPTHQLWLMGNHKPAVRSGGRSFWRRLRLIPFEHEVPEEKIVEDLQGILIREHGPAILAWIAQGAADYYRGGLREPETVKAATADYAKDQDTVAQFVEEQCHLGGGDNVKIKTSLVREAYEAWCYAQGEKPVTAKTLSTTLEKKHGIGRAQGSKGVRLYTNLSLISVDDESGESDRSGWR